MDRNKLIQWLLIEEEDDDDDIYVHFLANLEPKKSPNPLYKTRITEGYHQILINGHLRCDSKKFREFFRLNRCQLDYILDLIKENLTTTPITLVPKPTSPEEKLSVTLR